MDGEFVIESNAGIGAVGWWLSLNDALCSDALA
jgi:hypothetical protein